MLTPHKRLVVLLERVLSGRRLLEDGRAEELQVRELVSAPQLPAKASKDIFFIFFFFFKEKPKR